MQLLTVANAKITAVTVLLASATALFAQAETFMEAQPFALKSQVFAQLSSARYRDMITQRDGLNTLVLTLGNQRALLKAGPQTPDTLEQLDETDKALAKAKADRALLQCQIELRNTTCTQ